MLIIYITIAITVVLLLCTDKGQDLVIGKNPDLYDFVLTIFIGLIWPVIIVGFVIGTLWEFGLSKILRKPIQKVAKLMLGRLME